MKDNLKRIGYDSEEVYFHLKNQEALEKLREKFNNNSQDTSQKLPDNVIPLRPRASANTKTQGQQKQKKTA